MKKRLALVFAGVSCISVTSGCVSLPEGSRLHDIELSSYKENSKAFSDVNDLSNHLAKLKIGMTEAEAYQSLNVSSYKFKIIPNELKMAIIDGPQIPQPRNVEEQDRIQARVNSYKVAELSYSKSFKRGGVSLFLTSESKERGFNLKIRLLFKNGKLERTELSGTRDINKMSKETIFQLITGTVRNISVKSIGAGAGAGAGL